MANRKNDAAYTFGDVFALEDLKPAPTVRQPSPRDEALERAIRHAATLDPTKVLPVHMDPKDKPGTVLASARRIARRVGLPVNIGTNKTRPGMLLMSTGVLSNKTRKVGAALA